MRKRTKKKFKKISNIIGNIFLVLYIGMPILFILFSIYIDITDAIHSYQFQHLNIKNIDKMELQYHIDNDYYKIEIKEKDFDKIKKILKNIKKDSNGDSIDEKFTLIINDGEYAIDFLKENTNAVISYNGNYKDVDSIPTSKKLNKLYKLLDEKIKEDIKKEGVPIAKD